MAFKSAHVSRLMVRHLHASGFTRGFDISSDTDMLDVTTFADAAKAFIPGQDTSTLSIDMLLDTDASADLEFETVYDWKATSVPVSYGHEGFGRGSPVVLVSSIETQATTGSQVAGVATLAVTGQTDGNTDFGFSLLDLAAVTVDTNGASLDNGAATANGGVAHLHVSAFSGLSAASVIVEHSTNDSAWSTLATFTSVAGVTAERIVVAAGTSVSRYLRVRDDVTGTGSITRQVSFARR